LFCENRFCKNLFWIRGVNEFLSARSTSIERFRLNSISKIWIWNYTSLESFVYTGAGEAVLWRFQWPRGLRRRSAATYLKLRGSNPRREHGCLSAVSVECCQVEVSATSRSPVVRHCVWSRNLKVWEDSWTLKMVPTVCPETSITNSHYLPHSKSAVFISTPRRWPETRPRQYFA